jgi:mannose-6-phosphate isomerase
MTDFPLYPLRFAPIFQPRIWGGRRFADLFGWQLPGDAPIGEAWVLSDRDDYPSRVADGPLHGQTIAQLLAAAPRQLLGDHAGQFPRFPLLLKFLDARDTLSVQAHPSDRHKELLPPGERGKSEAWVVLEAVPESRIYAGVKPGTTADLLRKALQEGSLADQLPWFTPKPGDSVMLEAGTLHAIGGGIVLFEVQQNSDVTFRLYDWDRVDAQTGKPRQLHIDQGLACTDFARGAVGPVTPIVEAMCPCRSERLFDCEYFHVWRLSGQLPFTVGSENECRILVVIDGNSQLEHPSGKMLLARGDVVLLPARLGPCICCPTVSGRSNRPGEDATVTLLEIALPT